MLPGPPVSRSAIETGQADRGSVFLAVAGSSGGTGEGSQAVAARRPRMAAIMQPTAATASRAVVVTRAG